MKLVKGDPALPLWKQEPHPAVIAISVIVLFIVLGYAAYMAELLPVKPMSEFGMRLQQLARDSGGHFEKLRPADQKYVNEHTSGRGAMAVREAFKHL